MSTICGRYVRTFAEADLGMLDNISLNAPYPFFWVHLVAIERDELVCTGAGKELRLAFRPTRRGDRAVVVMPDPVFGPTSYEVHPFLREDGVPIGAAQGALPL